MDLVPEAQPDVIPAEEWAQWPDERLLDLRINQLGVTIEGSALETRLCGPAGGDRGARPDDLSSRTSGCRRSGSRLTACPASRSPSISRIRGSSGSNARRCSKSKAARPSGA